MEYLFTWYISIYQAYHWSVSILLSLLGGVPFVITVGMVYFFCLKKP